MESAVEFVRGLVVNLNLQSALLLVLVFLTAYWILGAGGRQKNLPPGPRGLPLLGNLLSFRPRNLLSNMAAWRQQYGDVFSLRIGTKPIVVLNGHRAIQDALVKQPDVFSDRPSRSVSDKDMGIVMSKYGQNWKRNRRLGLTALRQFGMGKRSLEGKVAEEARVLCGVLVEKNGASTDISPFLINAVSNVICSMSFGERYDYGDVEFQRLMRVLKDVVGAVSVSTFIPMMQKLLKFLQMGPDGDGNLWQEFIESIKAKIEEHRQTFDPSDIRDIIDVFLLETQLKDPDDDTSSMTARGLVNTLRDFFLGGAETTATTLKWGLLYLALNPEVQRKVQDEIDREFGASPPTMSQRGKLPYTEATILEIQRIRPIVPLSMPHTTSSATKLYGYDIPAKTFVIPNLWSAMMDPEVTPDPEIFHPERFLDEEGNAVRPEWFMPFSLGRRQCLGEQLAKMELFLFLTTLLQHFTFKLPDGAPAPSMKGKMGITFSPEAYQICAVTRDD